MLARLTIAITGLAAWTAILLSPLPVGAQRVGRAPAIAPGAPAPAAPAPFVAAAPSVPLAGRLPADTILYVGWQGTDALKASFQGSHLQAVVDASDMRALLDPFLPALIERVGRDDKDAADALNLMRELAAPLAHHPAAFTFGGVDWTVANGATPRVALLCEAGAASGDIKKRIDNLLKDAPPPVREKVTVAQVENLLTISIGYGVAGTPALLVDKGHKDASLAGNPTFTSALTHGGRLTGGPAVIVYLDVERALNVINTAVDRQGDPQEKRNWPKLREASGIAGAKQFIWTSGFDGKAWGDHMFLAAPQPRKGLLALLEGAPVSDTTLASIPQTATLAGATRFDAAKLVETIRTIIRDVDANTANQLDAMLRQVSAAVKVDIEKDLLGSLGDEWAYYTDPSVGGRGMLGLVVVNRLRDPVKAQSALVALEDFASAQMAAHLQQEGLKPQFFTTQRGGLVIHYLGTPLVSPAWAIQDGNLYAGLFPQVVAAAAGHVAGKGKSILDSPDFAATRRLLGGEKASSFSYVDLPRTAPDSYTQWVMISRLSGFADLYGVQSPAMLLPPLDKLLPQLSPAGSVSWVDASGFHARSIAPFPGSTALASGPFDSYLLTQPMALGVMLPSLSRARAQATRVKSANNLRQIALAGIQYANDHKGKFPDQLGDLMKSGDLIPAVFINPATNTSPPPHFDKPEQAAEWVDEHSDYVWAGKGKTTTAGADDVLAYEKLEGATQGINIAFADGHVEWFPLEAAREVLKKNAGGAAGAGKAAPR